MRQKLLTFFAALLCVANMWASVNADDYKLPGAFSVSSTKVVYFSQGNLQYIGSAATPYWKFADNQYEYFGTTTGQNSAATNVDRDLFGWATSGYNYTYPYKTSKTNSDYGPAITSGEFASDYDWGTAAAGNIGSGWRVLTNAEWGYLFNDRDNASQKYGMANVAGVNGLIILPDVYNGTAINIDHSDWNNNPIDASAWSAYEAAGAVFLPAAGYRNGNVYDKWYHYYWSSSASSANAAYSLKFDKSYVTPQNSIVRYPGCSVRLVSETAPPTMTETPLTFEAMVAGATVTYTLNSTKPVQYSLNGGDWTNYSSAITLTNAGDKVSFRGTNASSYSLGTKFECSKDCYIYGNIMSMVSPTSYATATSLTATYTFYQMFKGNTHIKNHPTKDLVLPATTLTDFCYYGMFYGCTGLTSAPELPATTLTGQCYQYMFYGCTGLTSAPELPATTLADYCYQGMFYGCTGLTSAPELPSTTLAPSCYSSMFEGCTNLATAPELPATTLAGNCYLRMFYGCTGLTSAPELPATTLTGQCYRQMFLGCTNLSSLTCNATTTALNATKDWLSDVSATGTFYGPKNSCFALETPGVSSIPEGWTFSPFQASLTSAPTAITGLVYTGVAQDLLNNDGAAEGGTLNYSLDNSTWSEEIPTATNAGDYTVYYMVVGDDEHADYIPENNTIAVSIDWSSMTDAPLTFEAVEAGATVTYTTQEGKLIEYSTDGTTWTTYSTAITLANVGDKVYFRGNNENYGTSAKKSQFSCSKDCYIYGNIMSLVDKMNYATTTSLTADWTFRGMFYENTRIKNHPTKDLVLPATTIAHSCYRELFYGCTGLTRAPQLPATMMKNSCYCQMFRGCTGLTAAPALPATTLSNNCYEAMFKGCTGLTSAPTLPGTFMMSACYYSMFSGCTSLTEAPALPATTLAKECYCYMFNGCTGLTATPVLPAKVIANDAYYEMFRNCSNLRTVTCYAKEKANTSATDNWLYGTATSGVLMFNAKYSHAWVNSDNTITRNVSSIPDGWDIAYIEEDVEDNSDITILNIPSIGYTGSPVEPTITVKDYNRVIPRGSDVEYTVTYYGVGSTDYVESSTAPINAGSYRAILTFQNDYSGVKEKAFTITNATPTVTAPTAKSDLVYTGVVQALLNNDGAAEGGTLNYSLNNTDWSEDIPAIKNAGDYTVYYKVAGDANHADFIPENNSIAVSIAKAVFTMTADDKWTDYGDSEPIYFTTTYSGLVNGESISVLSSIPTPSCSYQVGDPVGTYEIVLSEGVATNYEFTLTNGTLHVNKVAVSLTAPEAITDLTYNWAPQTLITAGSVTGGELQYRLGNGEWSTDLPQATEPDDYTVWYRVIGDQNHNNVTETSIAVTISLASGTYSITIHDVFNGGDYAFYVHQNMTINQLKQMLADQTAYAVDQMRLIFAGKQLEDGRTLGDYNIQLNAVINLVLRITESITANEDPQNPGIYYSTFYDSQYQYALPNDGTEAYVATISGDALMLTKIAENDEVIPENTAVILKATSNSFSLTRSIAEPVTFEGTNSLLGVDEPTAAPAHCYVLSGHGADKDPLTGEYTVKGVGFYQYTGTLKAHKAYAVISGGAAYAPKKLRFVFNQEQTTTDVENVQSDNVQCTKVLRNGQLYLMYKGTMYNVQGQIVK